MSQPSFLLIDAGNTLLKWMTISGRTQNPREQSAPTTSVTRTFVANLAKKYPRERVLLSSVVPRLIPFFERTFKGRLEIVRHDSPSLGLHFDYPTPPELGADRLAAAAAIAAEKSYPAIIVACGTATAFTVLDAKGRLCGGAIAPGLQAQLTALLGATAQLPDVSLKLPKILPAKSTKEAIQAGLLLNFQGGINEIVQQLRENLRTKHDPWIILTGGNAHHLIGAIDGSVQMRPLLVFEGLHIMATRHFLPRP